MKKYLLSGVAALGLLAAGAASAADLPSRKGPVVAPVYVPAFTWTGFYVGANAGWGFGNMDSVGVSGFGDLDGFVGGGQIGYNYQLGQIVLGLEADFQGADLKAGPSWAGLGIVGEGKTEWFGTVRGRVGYAFDRFLPYLTGGFAYGSVKTTLAPGVTINGLLPGPFDTDRLRGTAMSIAKQSGRSLEDVQAERAAQNPAGRFGNIEEFGAACAFLCSVHAGYITGQNLLMDGGQYPGTY